MLRNVGPNDLYLVSVFPTGVLPWIQESEGEGGRKVWRVDLNTC